MGYLYLLISKVAALIKMIAMKNCGNIATGAKNSVIINMLRALGCVLISLAVALVSGFDFLDTQGFVISAFAGISNGLCLFTWILAVQSSSLSLVETFCMTGGVVLPLIVAPFVFEGETVSLIQWIGSALLFVAMFCLSKPDKKQKISIKAVVLLVVCGLGNFGCVFTKKLFTEFSEGSVEVFQFYTFVFVLATLAVIYLFVPSKGSEQKPKFSKKVVLYIFIAIVMIYIFEYFATLSANHLSSGVYYPLTYIISMPLIFLADVLLYKEKITLSGIIGIVLVILSGVLINI